MKLRSSLAHTPRRLFALAALAAVVLGALAAPAPALAADAVAHSVDASGNVTSYTSVSDALNAGYTGATIVMDTDWDMGSGRLRFAGGKSITIDMCAHKIKSSDDTSTIYIESGAKVKLTSSKPDSDMTYVGSKTEEYGWQPYIVKTGGVITCFDQSKYKGAGAGISIGSSSTLVLENVAVAGSGRGGIYAAESCTIDLINAKVYRNRTGKDRNDGAGVYLNESCKLTMDASHISRNNGASKGGGIYAEKYVNITMKNGSTVTYNEAQGGGGVYFNKSFFKLVAEGEDGGTIANNTASQESNGQDNAYKSGGGIHVDAASGENEGLIEGVTIKDNYSGTDGGGLELDQRWTTLRRCTITGNGARLDGGGIFVYGSNNIVENCTITGNYCADNGKNQEGGGIFVGYRYDVKMSGTCVVKGNTRGKNSGNADDVFLSTLSGGGGKAYITGNLAQGSSVGVRTGIDGDRRIASKFKYSSKDCLFADMGGYHVSYGTDDGGDAWQRHTTREFELKVNGNTVNRYRNGTQVTITGAGSDDKRVFRRWSTTSTGLYPFADYVGDGTDAAISFKMPQNDVSLVGEYVARIGSISLSVGSVTVGAALPKSGTVTWADPDTGATRTLSVPVTWTTGTGSSPATGKATYYTKYTARIGIAEDLDNNIAFKLAMGKADVAVTVGGKAVTTTFASVDAKGRLSFAAGTVTAETPSVESVEPAEVSVPVEVSEEDLRSILPERAFVKTTAGTVQGIAIDTSQLDFSNLLDSNRQVRTDLVGQSFDYIVPLKTDSKAVIIKETDKLTLTVKVVEKPAYTVAAPTVDPADGEYSTANSEQAAYFEGEAKAKKFKVSLGWTVNEATIKYKVSYSDGGAWSEGSEQTLPDMTASFALDVKCGTKRTYKVEVWAEKNGVQSTHVVRSYVVEEPYATYKVTVNQTDTGKVPVPGTIGAYDVNEGGEFSLVAPVREGYAFEKWVDANGKAIESADDATLKLENVRAATTVTAVYNPVVSGLDVYMDLPEDEKTLAESATKLLAKIGDSDEYTDVSSYFGDLAIDWSPEAGESRKVEHATAYTAKIALKSDGSDDVKYVLAPNAEVRVGGYVVEGDAYVFEQDGKTSLCIQCPTTGPLEFEKATDPETVKLTFDEALTYSEQQGSSWGLPDTVKVSYKCGETGYLPVEWGTPTGFNENATGTQELTATGTIQFPSNVDAQIGETVTCKIKVGAPGKVAKPETDIESGTYTGTQRIWLTCDTEGAEIRYTTDGTDPTEESALYEDAIEVPHSCTVKAKAYRKHMTASDIAEWSYTIKHTVTFIDDDDSEPTTQTVEDGKCAERPKDLKKEGCTFEGWFTEEEEKYDFKSPVTGDLKLYAQWSAKDEPLVAYTVEFDAAGGSEVATKIVRAGGKVARPTDPTRKGFTFEGWFTEDGNEYDFDTPVTGNLKLYARWTAKDEADKKDDDGSDPDKGNSEKKDETPNKESGQSDATENSAKEATAKTKTVTTTTKSVSNKGLAATGDRTPLIVGALVLVGILAAAAGVITKRKK